MRAGDSKELTYLVVCDCFLDIIGSALCVVRVWYEDMNIQTLIVGVARRTDGRHMAQDLGAIDPYPIERRVRENVDIVPIQAVKSPIQRKEKALSVLTSLAFA